MPTVPETISICQGADWSADYQYVDAEGLGIDLTGASIRMQIRTPDRTAATAIFDVTSGTPTAAGSAITLTANQVIAATTVTDFRAGGVVEATGAGFSQLLYKVFEEDPSTLEPTSLTSFVDNIAQVADKATIATSTSNDGVYRVASIVDADTITVLPETTVEAPLGGTTITITREGRFNIKITAAESSAWTFARGEYDIELTLAGDTIRLAQGSVVVDQEVTR